MSASRKRGKPARKAAAGRAAATPVMPSGGNRQIKKGYREAPVKAYIAAMPGWKRDVGRRLDALIERTVPGASKQKEVRYLDVYEDDPPDEARLSD